MFTKDYEKEWFLLKAYISRQDRISKQELLDKMTQLEISRWEEDNDAIGNNKNG